MSNAGEMKVGTVWFCVLCLIWETTGFSQPRQKAGSLNFDLKEEAPVELPSLSLDGKDSVSLTLQESVNLAIRAATSVLQAQNNVTATGATLLQSYGQFLPNLTTQANFAYTGGTQYLATATPTTVNGTSSGLGVALKTDLNLFNGLSDLSQLKASLGEKGRSGSQPASGQASDHP